MWGKGSTASSQYGSKTAVMRKGDCDLALVMVFHKYLGMNGKDSWASNALKEEFPPDAPFQ